MELIERAEFTASLQAQFEKTREGQGHCVFIGGEAGIGKTSLVNAFCQSRKNDCTIYLGTCDALFTPRPLAPLYDIAWQMGGAIEKKSRSIEDRSDLFLSFLQALSHQPQPVIVVFEDIHWADEATLDFIKFFSRRITQTACLFLLTYRDNEIHTRHPLRNVLGELVPGSFTRLLLPTLSIQAVEKLANAKGYKGEDVYSISGGNPFYVQEILASYSPGIPETIKDSILLVYNRQDESTKYIWAILSILPTGLESSYLEQVEPQHETAIENSLSSRILVLQEGRLLFKHELYRRTIEQSLSPLKRISLNKRILDLFRVRFDEHKQIERIIHHAKNANEYDLVVQYAPIAARQAASVGAHIEASKLYLSAIDYYQGNDKDVLLPWYEAYAYECYLTNQINEAIIYQGKVLTIWRHKANRLQEGNSLRFLSRLWWFDGNREQAEKFALEAIDVLENQPASSVKAMAFSNLSQLKMLSDQTVDCLYWGEKAIAMARELQDEEILSHALNNVGTVQVRYPETRETGAESLRKSLAIALKNGYHEHAARAYTNLNSNLVSMKDFATVPETLEEGISYCEERDLDSWLKYMLSVKARLNLETGNWKEAARIAGSLLENEQQTPIIKIGALTILATIRMRTGGPDALAMLLEAKAKAFVAQELQRIIPVLVALLEYEWLTDQVVIEPEAIRRTIELIEQTDHIVQNSEFAFWLLKVRKQAIPLKAIFAGYDLSTEVTCHQAASLWAQLGSPYEQALLLVEGDEEDKRKAIAILHELGAETVYEKLKQQMRADGIKHIPRGIRQTTRSNPAQLTTRELDILQLLKQSLQNKEIATRLFISAKTVDHHISSVLSKLEVNSRMKAVEEALRLGIIK
ncbi:AAA family ATPase [Spirosoma sp. HMF4905]|uniref:AAA family ATPase n=1 Tax=Spirosoma arboris TaxID=2682092 RepID=A0A7K1SHM4_9BACT|nr:helix-turn-helix transcriptional regulator [Spirosoma arboris]MVM33106.1 AAA family ATPase [Spirosoma arboris]